jgi:misacylated tRNA(Ala) deacylase
LTAVVTAPDARGALSVHDFGACSPNPWQIFAMTERLYLEDPYLQSFEAEVLVCEGGWCALSRTAFYPGGGGQPADRGTIGGRAVMALREGDDGTLWHQVVAQPGTSVAGAIEWPFRHALMRQHALLHIVNTIARDRHGAAMTGCQLGLGRSRIDFKIADFSRDWLPSFEAEVNAVIDRALPVSSSTVSEAELRDRPGLVRTLTVRPPVVDGRVRVVAIAGFDEQACGGTHVHSTGEIGRVRLAKVDNKGRDNRRFTWETVDG